MEVVLKQYLNELQSSVVAFGISPSGAGERLVGPDLPSFGFAGRQRFWTAKKIVLDPAEERFCFASALLDDLAAPQAQVSDVGLALQLGLWVSPNIKILTLDQPRDSEGRIDRAEGC